MIPLLGAWRRALRLAGAGRPRRRPPAATRTGPASPSVAVVAAWTLLVVAGCTGGGSDDLAVEEGSGPGEGADQQVEDLPCRTERLGDEPVVHLTGADPVAVAAAVAGRTHRCAPVVVLAPAQDRWAAALASAVATAGDGPLLLTDPLQHQRVAAELARLEPEDVVAVGVDASPFDEDGETLGPVLPDPPPPPTAPGETIPVPGADEPGDADEPGGASSTPTSAAGRPGGPDDPATGPSTPTPAPSSDPVTEMALAVVEHLGASELLAVPQGDDPGRMAALGRLEPGQALLPLPEAPAARNHLVRSLPEGADVTVVSSNPATAEALAAEVQAAGVPARALPGPLWPDRPSDAAWLTDPLQGSAVAVAAVAANQRDEPLLPVDLSDLRNGRDRTERLRHIGPSQVALVGDATPAAVWQVPLILEGPALPGGGFRLFEDQRIVALYGHPTSSALGALGEQDLDATVQRTRRVAEPYGQDGRRVLPAFEIIATVASAEAGDRGDYSRRTAFDVLRPYIDRAAQEGFYVVLDLQSGRTDFLTQAKEYEELLLQPHVGLALDPEWRLKPDQRHLRQIGSVAAEEVQQVADWLAELTRENQLPEKLLVLHQFQHAMLPDRDTIVAPPELAVVVHMDGQGPIGTKDGTYRSITEGVEDRWLWGWKNFYDEDTPTPSPEHVLALEPRPVFVTYQ